MAAPSLDFDHCARNRGEFSQSSIRDLADWGESKTHPAAARERSSRVAREHRLRTLDRGPNMVGP